MVDHLCALGANLGHGPPRPKESERFIKAAAWAAKMRPAGHEGGLQVAGSVAYQQAALSFQDHDEKSGIQPSYGLGVPGQAGFGSLFGLRVL